MENKELQQYIFDLQQFQIQVKFWHWQTKMYAKHKTFCELFDFLSKQIDEFTEISMGKFGRPVVDGVSYTFVNFNDNEVNKQIDNCIEMCINLNNILDSQKDSDLLNLRDETIAMMNKVKYLLTLK